MSAPNPTANLAYWTSPETAGVIRCTDDHLRHLRSQGKGPPYTQVSKGGRILYAVSDVEAWLKKNRRSPRATK